MLLRGQKPGLYDRYFTQFEQEETGTREAVGQLIELLGQNDQARTTAEYFLEAHLRMGDQYRNALRFYRMRTSFRIRGGPASAGYRPPPDGPDRRGGHCRPGS